MTVAGGTKLCLLLLLGSYALAQQDTGSADEYSCRLARRYKNFRRYVYDYEAASVNMVNGASEQKSGPKITCKVEFDVPQACSFIMRTTDCSLMEISGLDSSGNTVYVPAPGSEVFMDEMARNSLKFQVSESGPKLYPEDHESKNILNIKRGIISALMVPPRDDLPMVEMPTAHGQCVSEVTEKARDETSSEFTVRRDLSRCEGLILKQHTSPLALLSGLNFPLSKLISSEQTCDYRFDNQKRHMSGVSCTETHLFMPFSHQNKYGIMTQVEITMNLREVSKINDRVFEYNEANVHSLHMEAVDDKSPVQTKDTAMSTFQELLSLKDSAEEDKRPMLFRRLVLELRGLNGEATNAAALDMFELSQRLSLQALVQCGSPECLSALLKVLRTFPHEALEVDAVVFGLGMLPSPSPRLLTDLLEMAKYKQSKAIMYALGNTAKKVASAEGLIPEVRAVYDFFMSILGADCAGDKELSFLTLRVVGNLGDVLEAIDPSIKGTLLKCMRQPATTLSVQLAAIQAFRRMDITEEVRSNLQRVCQYPKGAVQKRLAAYLMLMRSYQDSDIEIVKKLLEKEQNPQVKSFIVTHISNILTSSDDDLQELRSKLEEALENMPDVEDYKTGSRNFRLPGVKGNLIFDPSSQLPREVLLETTLDVFGYKMNLFEMGMEGKGFEPTVETLFGQNGFFPDTISKALYWTEEKVNPSIRDLLSKWTAPLKIPGQTVSDDLIREIIHNFNKVMKDLQNSDAPDAMAYLRFMGSELGYIKTNEMESVVQNIRMYSEILMYLMPRDMIFRSFMNGDNDLFVHYMFMDNKFSLPTASGLPLRFHMTGTFTPGLKGKVTINPAMKELLFRPSAGVEFMTKIGVHVPELMESSVEMTSSVFHESSLNARVSMERDQIKVSMPTPTNTIKLLNARNEVRIIGLNTAQLIQPTQTDVSCQSRLPGIKLCFTVSGTESRPNQPYFPLNGASQYLVDIRPADEAAEYTATISYNLLSEGKDGRHKVDTVKVALRVEGGVEEPMEASLLLKYNRNKNMLTSELQVPDMDVEAGLKIGMMDSSSRGKALTLEITNKNVPQLSLIGRTKLQAGLSDGMVQLQMLVPSLMTDASLTANINRVDGLMLELRSDIKVPETTSLQSITFKFGDDEAEVKLMSNVNAETKMLVKYSEAARAWLRLFMSDVMDQRVINTDMKVRHIVNKGLEAGTIWMDKFKADFPYIETLQDSITNMEMPELPENLFMNFESKLNYNFNKDRMIIYLPVPFGGKTSEELQIPAEVITPIINVPQVDMYISPKTIQLPAFTIPSEYEISVPLMGKMVIASKVESNLYNWDATVSVGNYSEDSPSYKADYSVKAESPFRLLSFSNTGSAELFEEFNGVTTSLSFGLRHELLRSEIKVRNNFGMTENIWSEGRITMTAKGPGVHTSMSTTAQFTLAPVKLSGDLNSDATMTVGPNEATCTSQNTFSFEPAKREAKAESTVRFNSDPVNLVNKIKMTYANSELSIDSNTNMNSEPLKHTTKINVVYKDIKLSIQSDSVTKASEEKMLRSQMELLASGEQVTLRIENQADDSSNRAYSLLTGALTPSGLEVNSDASVNIFASLASHKATLTFDSNGLTTSCTTTAQLSPFTFENVFHAGADTSGATMSLTTKGGIKENKAELSVEGKISSSEVYLNSVIKGNVFDLNGRNRVNLRLNEDGLIASNNMVASYNEISTKNSHTFSLTLKSFTLQSKTDNLLDSQNSYMHDITVSVERFATNMIMKSQMKVMNVDFNNDVQFKALPYIMELVGTTIGKYNDEEVRHTYEFKFVDFVLSAKCNTNGKLLDYHIAHNADVEISWLTMKFNDVANMNSPIFRVDSVVKASAEPFSLNMDAICNSNTNFYFFGEKNGEMYTKFLMKAEPMMFVHSFEQRASASIKNMQGETFQSSMDNKFDSLITLKEQTINLKLTSNLDEHTFNNELKAFNNAEKIGIEMSTAASSSFMAKEKQDYIMSSFMIYEKNGESHIMIPFIEHLPAVIENIRNTMMSLLDQGINAVKDANNKYMISTRVTNKIAELKEVIDNFDMNLFIQDVKKFISSIESTLANLTTKFPKDKIVAMLKSVKEMIMTWMKKYNIIERVNIIYSKMEEILSNYEVEKMIGAFMDELVKIMKQYQVREKIQAMFTAIKSIDIKPFVKKVILPIQGLVSELYAVDFKQFVEDFSDFIQRLLQKVHSFDSETFSIELTEVLKELSAVPCLGKLAGEVRVISPLYKMKTNVNVENNTVSDDSPDFLFSLKSNADSVLKPLEYTLEASANVALPRMSYVAFTESVKFDHYTFQLDHQESVNIYKHSALASAETTAKANTELYKGELISKASLTMENGISSKMETNYNHDLRFPKKVFTNMALHQMTSLELQDGSATLKMENAIDGKINSHEANHKSDMEVVFDLHTAKIAFNGVTGCTNMKVTKKLDADICIFQHFIASAKMETEAPFLKNSIAEAKIQAKVEDLTIDLSASHNAELVGKIEGTIANSVVASVTPDDVTFDSKNKVNAKVVFIHSSSIANINLSGKTDFQNDFSFNLNPMEQRASWTGLARFNQFRYSHFVSMDNGEREINIVYQINGEANLDMLKEKFTIYRTDLPYIGVTIPSLEDVSLWEDAGLAYFFLTTQQTLDISSNLKYVKNPDMIVININMDPVINAINTNAKALHKRMLMGKDKAAEILAQTQEKYEKYSAELPKSITIPAYTIPLMDVETSTYTIPLPDPKIVRVPLIRFPSALSKLSIPKVTLPRINSIYIPRLGEMTYDFSMKTAMLTIKTTAGIFNNDDAVTMKLDASSTSEFWPLSGDIQGSAAIKMIEGLSVDSNLVINHDVARLNHNNAMIVSPVIDMDMTNTMRSDFAFGSYEILQKVNKNQGIVVSLSAPSYFNLIGAQVMPKSMTNMKARVFARYPSEEEIDIVALQMSMEKSLNIQANWNMEMLYNTMLTIKDQIPRLVDNVLDVPRFFYNEMYHSGARMRRDLVRYFERSAKRAKAMFRQAVETVATMEPYEFMTTLADDTLLAVRNFRSKVDMIFDSMAKFLREVKFQIPGYKERMTGFQLYEICAQFIADLTEEAIEKVPKYFSDLFTPIIEYFESLEFQFSNHVVRGSEIIEDFTVAFKRLQEQVKVIVKRAASFSLEEIIKHLNSLSQFFMAQYERLLEAVRSVDVDGITDFLGNVYEDMVHSEVLKNIVTQCEKIYMILMDYFRTVKARIQAVLEDFSVEDLKSDMAAWMDRLIKNMNAFQNNIIETLKEETKAIEPYVKVADRHMEIDLPFPFVN